MSLENESSRRNRSKSWWQQRTKMERRLIFTIIIAILLIIGLTIGTAVAASVAHSKETPCLTESCVHEAAHLLKCIDPSVNPCDDFYDFVCGNYIKETEIPDDKSELDPLSIIGAETQEQVKKVVLEPVKPGELRPFVMLKKFYATCMNTTAIEATSVDHLKRIFTDLGGAPILEGNSWKESNWLELTRKLRQYGYPTGLFLNADIEVNPKDSNELIISVDQATNEEISNENLKDGITDELVNSFADNLIDLSVLLGVDKEFATKEVHDVIAFRSKIAAISVTPQKRIELLIAANATTVDSLQKEYPSISWLELFTGSLAFKSATITGQSRVLLIMPNYVSKFEEIISKTPKRVQVNYAMLHILRSSVKYLPKSFRSREQKFMSSVTGTTKAEHRSLTCIGKASEFFALAADALYVRKYVDEKARVDVTDMVSRIKKVFVKILKEVDWMDSETRRQAIDKAESMNSLIAYPSEILEDDKLDTYYKELKFDSDNILDLVNEASKFKKDQNMVFYGSPVPKNHWTIRIAATTGNAVYDPQTNTIQIPSGIMQKEFYKSNRPQYMNYGGLGMVIGHEITHGFDDTGKGFDKHGNKANWWEDTTLNAYSSKAECFVQQYSNFTVPEVNMTVNGQITLGENIADNGGVKEAYLAYLDWIKDNKEEPSLPAINYTAKQLFWISLANSWCTKMRTNAIEQQILGDEHTINKFRIIGGLANAQHFAEDFNCPVGSKMNPVKKCQIW